MEKFVDIASQAKSWQGWLIVVVVPFDMQGGLVAYLAARCRDFYPS